MGFLMPSPPKPAPLPKPLPPAPERTDTETAALAEEQRRVFGGASSGRASTFLTASGTTAGSSVSRFLGSSART